MADRRNFNITTWKLDIMNAVNADTRLRMSDRVIAHELLYYASEDGEIFPSQELLANTVGLKPRAIKGCIKRLVDAGWVRVHRQNRSKSNRYLLSDANVEFFNRRRQKVRDELASVRGTKMPLRNHREGQNGAPVRGTKMPPNTSSEHVKVGIEGTGIGIGPSAARPYVAPDFDTMQIEIEGRAAKARRREGVS